MLRLSLTLLPPTPKAPGHPILLRPHGADLFKTTCQALVVPTNTLATQGAGLAKLAARAYPGWERGYKAWCRAKSPVPGDVCIAELEAPLRGHRWVIAVLTKGHWRFPSKLSWIAAGLLELEAALAAEPEIDSIAIPALGCGAQTGQLAWRDVEPLMMATAERLAARGVRVEVYEPHGEAPAPARRRSR